MENTTPDDFDALHVSHEDIIIQPMPLDQAEATPSEDTRTAENMLPPEAQGEVNGGPLGCCLGVTVGLFLSLTVAIFSRLYADPLTGFFQQNYGLMGIIIRFLMGILAFLLAILCGRFGWKLGSRFYREYEAPPTKKRKRKPTLRHQKI